MMTTTVRCAMEPSPLVKELQERIARIRDHAAACPDLSGFELAFDRGNLTAEEFAAAKEEIDRCQRSIKEEAARIDQLAAAHPAEYDHFLAGSAAQLRRILDFLNQTASTTFEQRFVIPPMHREEAIMALHDPLEFKGAAGFGFITTPERSP